MYAIRSTITRTPRMLLVGIAALIVAVALLAAWGDGRPASSGSSEDPVSGQGTTASAPVERPTGDLTRESVAPTGDAGGASADLSLTAPDTGAAAAKSSVGAVAPVAGDVTSSIPALDAKIVRTAGVGLRVRRGSFESAWSDAQSVASGFGGYVVDASRSGTTHAGRVGTITMRVPTRRFDAAVDRLRGLERTKVERLDVSSQDVTEEYVDTRSRLKHDRAVEARFVTLLARAETVSEVLAVQTRLDQVQEQIEVEQGRLQYLDKLTAMSTIELTLRERSAAGGSDDEDSSVLGEAWDDATTNFSDNVAGGLVWLGGALPALLLLAMIAVGVRIWTSRRNSRAEQGIHE